jgi:DNA-binding transcriptional ArsR family regulator
VILEFDRPGNSRHIEVCTRHPVSQTFARRIDAAGRDAIEPTGYETKRLWVMGPTDTLDATFAALADPTRRAILSRLADGDATVTELAAPFAMSQPAVSKHLKVLERAGLISRGRDAQRRPCRLEPERLRAATDWLENYRRYWEESYARLDALLADVQHGRDGREGREGREGRDGGNGGGASSSP